MSVIFDVGQDPETAIEGLVNFALCAISVGLLRQLGFEVVPAPLEAEENHAEVRGPKTHRLRSQIAKSATWVIQPSE
jgi:hypothetical protein